MEKSKKKNSKMCDILKIVIIIFTISVLTMNVAQAGKPDCKRGCPPPAIVSYEPLNLTIYDNPPATETFSITVNQTVDVTWFFDGAVHKTDNSVNASSDIIDTNLTGVHNVTAVAQNEYGLSVSQTWTWNVYPPPQIVYSEPEETILNDTEPASRNFFIILDQDTNATWCHQRPSPYPPLCWPPTFIPAGARWGPNNLTTDWNIGTNIVTITASNNNGTVSKSWTWIVNYDPLLHPAPNITAYYPQTPQNVTAPRDITFGVATDVAVDVTWCMNGNCDPIKREAWACMNYNYCMRTYTFNTPGTQIIVANVSTREQIPVYSNQTWIVNVS